MTLLLSTIDAGHHESHAVRQPRYDRLSQAMAFFQLGHLLKAGVPIDSALSELEQLEPLPAHKRIWRDIRQHLDEGIPLSMAFARWHRVFEHSVIALLQAGEASGQLETILHRLDDQLRWQHSVASRLAAVMSYPLLAGSMIMAVSLFLLGSVVPSMAGFLNGSGAELPWHAQALLTLASLVESSYPSMAMGSLVIIVIGGFLPAMNDNVRFLRDLVVVRLWGIGSLIAGLSWARYCRTLAMLNQNGVALVEALEISEGVIKNEALRLELVQVRSAVLSGDSLADAFEQCNYVPSTMRRMIAAGEMAGALNDALNQNAEQLQLCAGYRIDRIERLMGPALLMFCGGLLLWIIISILLPVYDVAMQAGVL